MKIRSDSYRLLPTRLAFNKLPEAQQLRQREQMTEPWTSVEGVARHLGVAKDSIYRWIDRRGLPAHRIGRLWNSRSPRSTTGSAPAVRIQIRKQARRTSRVLKK